MSRRIQSGVLALLVVLSATTFGAASLVAADANTTGATGSPHGASANYTVDPDNHKPGNEDGAVNHYATGLRENLSAIHFIEVRSKAFDFADCSADKTRAFGIDRGNNNSGTKTDESLLTAYKSIEFKPNKIVVEFYKEGSIAGEPKKLYTFDQIVARGVNCYDNPKEKGWYQIHGKVNGSLMSSNNKGTDFSQETKTHYIYVCDCSSRQEAVKKLGPPPSQGGGGGDGGGGGGDTATQTQTTTGGGGGGGNATTTQTTAGTATGTQTGGGGGNATTTQTTAGTATGTQTGGATTTQGGQTDTTASGSTGVDGGTTPTSGGGPGFGAAVALVALLIAALLSVRGDR